MYISMALGPLSSPKQSPKESPRCRLSHTRQQFGRDLRGKMGPWAVAAPGTYRPTPNVTGRTYKQYLPRPRCLLFIDHLDHLASTQPI